MNDEATRRQLRFSLFLQSFAIVMLGAAAGVRLFAFGFDAVTAVLLVALLVVIAATGYTWTKMRSIQISE